MAIKTRLDAFSAAFAKNCPVTHKYYFGPVVFDKKQELAGKIALISLRVICCLGAVFTLAVDALNYCKKRYVVRNSAHISPSTSGLVNRSQR